MRDMLRKITLILMAVIILLPSISLTGVKTAFAVSSAGSASADGGGSEGMARSMIQFFQKERQTLAVDRVARDELLVYGIFLSNFYTPWATTLGDMIDDSGEGSIPKDVSKRFFGSADRSSEVIAINKKLYEAIVNSMGADKKQFAMYASKPNEASAPMSGKDLYELINGKKGKKGERKIYSISGKDSEAYMDLDNPATRASLQVIFGIEPSMFVAKDKGLSKITEMYIDGLGNIWGAYEGAALEDYVLIMPAVLNPRVYATGGSKNFKFPVSNTFVMGANVKMTEDLVTTNKDNFMKTPYYNIPERTKAKFDKDNLVNVYGVYTPLNYLGNSDSIIKEGVAENPFKSHVSDFLGESYDTVKSRTSAKIIVSVNGDRLPSSTLSHLAKDDYDRDRRAQFLEYFTTSTVFGLDSVADEMYYFTNPQVSSEYNAGDSSSGSFANVEDLIKPSELFTYDDGGGVRFYNASSSLSPFSTFQKGYLATSDKNTYLKNFGIDTDSKYISYLKNFLEEGTWGIKDSGKIAGAMKLLNNDAKVYEMLTPSESTEKVMTDALFKIIPESYDVTAASLTKSDKHAMYLSIGKNIFEGYSYISTHTPFKVTSGGGQLSSVSTDTHTRQISTYFHNFYSYRVFGMNRTVASQLTGTSANTGGFKSPWGNFDTNTAIMDGVNNYAGMYWGLMVSLLGIEASADKTGFTDPIPFQNSYLPYMEIDTLGGDLDLNDALGTAGLVSSEDMTLEQMQKDIVKKVYGILQTGTSEYRNELVKSFQESWVLSTHRAIVGTWKDNLSVSAGGTGGYASSVNFLSMPSLTDLPLTDWLLEDYLYIYLFMMMIVLILLTLMFITNRRTLGETVLVGAFLAFVLILPQFLVNNVLQLSNKAADSIFSEKFDYWAIVQHQQSDNALASSKATGDELDYIIANSMQDAKAVYSTDAGVRVKWMSPKKLDNFQTIFNDSTASDNLLKNLKIFRWLFNSQLNQEEYALDDPLATYVYRPYTAIAREAKSSHSSLLEKEVKTREVLDKVLLRESTTMGVPDYRFKLYKSTGSTIKYPKDMEPLIKEVKPYLSNTEVKGVDDYRYWYIANSEVTDAIFRTDYSSDAGLSKVNNTDDAYYKAFLLSTESPFYYFYNVFQNRYSYGNTRFKDSLMKEELFRVTSKDNEIDGTLRDFLDMEGLFTYVVPYLHQANSYVYGWTDLYGRTIEGYDFTTGSAPNPEDGETENEKNQLKELADQFKREKDKKANLEKVWMMYTPWVDALYDNLGAQSATAKVAEKRVGIADALNPGAYEEQGRAMIFSEADMRAKSYRYSDLTDMERRIQAVLDETYEDMLYLVNYYDFDDDVLLTAAAMTATFNFNAEFSSNTLIGEGVTMYPQNYEMKNFNYDAFMRLILLNSTGEALIDDKGNDLYSTILAKTSIFTGIMLIICDLLGVIFIPAMKILAVLLLLILTLAICLSSVITPPEKIVQTVVKQIGLPVLFLLVSNIIFSWIVGIFMGDGLESYVGSQSASISITDPTITMVLLIVLDLVYIYVLFIICKMLLKGIKSYFTSLFFGGTELLSQVGSKAFMLARHVAKNRSISKRHNEILDAMGNKGTGASSTGTGLGGSRLRGEGGLPPLVNQNDSGTGSGGAGGTGSGQGSNAPTPKAPMDVDKLASTPNTVGTEKPKKTMGDRIRNTGNKYVDFKVGLSRARFKLSEGKDYVVGGGLGKDIDTTIDKGVDTVKHVKNQTVDGVKRGVDNTKRGAVNSYLKASETMSHIRQYEIDKKNKLSDEIYYSKHASDKTKEKRSASVREGFYKVANSQQDASARRSKLKTKYNI